LKIKETRSLLADGHSSADLRHGPIAAVTRGFPLIALNTAGPASSDVNSLVDELRGRGAQVLVVSADPGAESSLPEELVPVLAVVRGQQVARELALALGFDPYQPAGFSKVAIT
jgi:glucosamine--fructose-6-phosphate aminotransferase (isomerizing)